MSISRCCKRRKEVAKSSAHVVVPLQGYKFFRECSGAAALLSKASANVVVPLHGGPVEELLIIIEK